MEMRIDVDGKLNKQNIIFWTEFHEGFILMDDLNGLEFMQSVNGSVPDGVYDKDTGFFFCCRSDGDVETPIVLPKDQPFVLFMANGSTECQSVRGKQLVTSS